MANVDPALLDAARRRDNLAHLARIAEHIERGEYEQALSLASGVVASLRAACARPERDLTELLRAATYAAQRAGLNVIEEELAAATIAAHLHWNAVEATGGRYATETAFGTRTGD
jgi:hypothetical protein